jgi:nucleotide-binding universal stress UspA family protein
LPHSGTLIVILALAALVLALVIWSTRRSPQVSADVAQARQSVSALRRILVPVRGFPFEQRAVELACRLGQEQKSEIVLAFVLEVPLTLSLGAPLPEEEEKAAQALARSSQLVRLHGLNPVERTEREREAGRGILKVAKEMNVDLVVVGLDPNRGLAIQPIGPTTETLLRRADFEVIVDRTAPPRFD